MTLRDKLNDTIITNIFITESENRMYYEFNHLELAIECEKIADDYAIEILERYHNSLFIIPLKEGEAKEILKHIKNENTRTTL
jgi:hypothetical protein